MLIGYARVSTADQGTDLQRDALRRAGVRKVYEETRSGATAARPELARALDALRPGDVLVVFKLDRLARSLRDLLALIDTISAAGAHLRSLTEPVDTSSPAGEMVVHMLGAVAQFERGLIVERSRAGVKAAQARGVRFGRPAALTEREARAAAQAYRSGRSTLTALARLYGCHLSSIKRAIARADAQ